MVYFSDGDRLRNAERLAKHKHQAKQLESSGMRSRREDKQLTRLKGKVARESEKAKMYEERARKPLIDNSTRTTTTNFTYTNNSKKQIGINENSVQVKQPKAKTSKPKKK